MDRRENLELLNGYAFSVNRHPCQVEPTRRISMKNRKERARQLKAILLKYRQLSLQQRQEHQGRARKKSELEGRKTMALSGLRHKDGTPYNKTEMSFPSTLPSIRTESSTYGLYSTTMAVRRFSFLPKKRHEPSCWRQMLWSENDSKNNSLKYLLRASGGSYGQNREWEVGNGVDYDERRGMKR